jgi:predicted metal-binding membrane protein
MTDLCAPVRQGDAAARQALRTRRTLHGDQAVVWSAVGIAWTVIAIAAISGHATMLHHDALVGHGSRLDIRLTMPLFLAAWTAMVVAMMLPSTIGTITVFKRASTPQPDRRQAALAFIGGYLIVWLAFGDIALAGDALVHRFVDRSSVLTARPWLISGAVLTFAGAFQFSKSRMRCLRICRHPVAFVIQRYRPGVSPAFILGASHAKYCLGCCWPLMLLMFAAGVANLWWMAALTVVMVYEKAGRRGEAVASAVGASLLIWAALVFIHPMWLPHAIAAVR